MADVHGYDDERVTLGDGCLNIESAVFGTEKVGGSRSFVRDPRLSHLANGRPGASRPEYGCIAPIPLDEEGNLMRFCSRGHYTSRKRFGQRARNFLHSDKSGLDDICLDCRKRQRRQHTSSNIA